MNLFGLDMNLYVVAGIKAVAAVGAFFVGFMVGGPLTRLLTRLAFHRPPGGFALWVGRLASAGLAACLAWFLLVLGLGGGGWGWGGGGGPGSGAGNGAGPGNGSNGAVATVKDKPGVPKKELDPTREIVKIEMLGGERFKGGDRYYLIGGKEPAKTLEEVIGFNESNKQRFRIVIVITPNSVSRFHHAVQRLQSYLRKTNGVDAEIQYVE